MCKDPFTELSGEPVVGSEKRARRLRREVRALTDYEDELERGVAVAERSLATASENHAAHAYITYADLRGIARYRNQTVIPIKAPPDTRLNVSTAHLVTLLATDW